MILLNYIIQVLTAADPDRILPSEIELIPHPHSAQCRMGRLETVERDGPRLSMSLECFAEERLRGSDIPHTAQMRFHRFAACIHGALVRKPGLGKIDGISDDSSQNRA